MGIGKECEWRSFLEIPVACTIVKYVLIYVQVHCSK